MNRTILIDDAGGGALAVFEQGWPTQAPDTVFGWGSSHEHTRAIRGALPRILDEFAIGTMNDARLR